MPHLRDILNEIKWTKDLKRAEIWIRHRGAPHDTLIISGADIVSIGRSFLETTTTMIPYHRILRIIYLGEIVYQR